MRCIPSSRLFCERILLNQTESFSGIYSLSFDKAPWVFKPSSSIRLLLFISSSYVIISARPAQLHFLKSPRATLYVKDRLMEYSTMRFDFFFPFQGRFILFILVLDEGKYLDFITSALLNIQISVFILCLVSKI